MSGLVHIRTYGCQMNVRDSEAAAALLESRGYRLTDDEDEADVLIVNTCSIRGKAEDKARGKLALMIFSKQARPGRMVGAIGCMVQRMGSGVLTSIKGLDFALGPHRLARLPQVIEAVRAGEGPVLDAGETREGGAALDGHLPGSPIAFVNILYGCDRRCAYCIVPDVRGREWSRPATDVLKEVGRLAAAGVREVTLLGQSVMMYGKKNPVWPAGMTSPGGYEEPLSRLLEAASRTGLARVRFTSGHPSGCTGELARVMAATPEVCEHLHMPVQSGSDAVLARMRRGYTVDDYRRAAARLREAMPDFALTTDVIVGFPGETEEDFERTRAFMDEMRFDNAFIFKYSPRSGTPAAAWPDDVPAAEKMRRNKILLVDQDRRGMEIHEPLIGREIEVLAEGPSLRNESRWCGRTRTNKIAFFVNPGPVKVGDLVRIRITRVLPQTLYGDLVAGSVC
jgi:tRNA-2-methylthio-N6-dimethylallyladenosine synthase